VFGGLSKRLIVVRHTLASRRSTRALPFSLRITFRPEMVEAGDRQPVNDFDSGWRSFDQHLVR
jgi:hypothetical protein